MNYRKTFPTNYHSNITWQGTFCYTFNCNRNEIFLNEAIGKFIEHLKPSCAQNTVYCYSRDIYKLFYWIQYQNHPTDNHSVIKLSLQFLLSPVSENQKRCLYESLIMTLSQENFIYNNQKDHQKHIN